MTITALPLPKLSHLLFLGYLGQPGGGVLAEPWLRPGDLGGLWASRSAWSLAILADAFERARGRKPVVAVPEYICNQSLWPLRQTGARLVFVPVDEATLALDLNRFVTFDMVLAVHYFGWPAELDEVRSRAIRRAAWLVEDAAHVLRPIEGIGEAGDATLYSPHKLLAAPDGAVMAVRPSLQAAEARIVESAAAAGWGHPDSSLWRIKRLVQASPFGRLLKPGGQPDFATDPATQPMKRLPAPSPAAAALIARADLPGIAARRAANWTRLAGAVAGLAGWRPLLPLQGDVAPYRLAMRCDDFETASALYARLRAAGLPVESWPDLPPEVAPDSAARRLRATVLMLPCHQGCDPDELAERYAKALGGKG